MSGFSIIIPVKEINDYLRESIQHLLEIDHPLYEVIILPNDQPLSLDSDFHKKRVRILSTGAVSPAVKRDIGAKSARYEYLSFMDDDAYPPPNWLSVAESTFKEKPVAAIGGPGITPPGATIREIASGLFFETLVGGGGMSHRYRPVSHGFFVDDYPSVNLIIRKEIFMELGGFGNAFWPGEDTKFCLDLVNAGHQIWYEPKLLVFHHRRPSILGHILQVGNYGLHRGHFARVFPKTSARIVYFVPSLFLLSNLFLLLIGFTVPSFWSLWGILLMVYLTAGSIDVLKRSRDPGIFVLTLLLIAGSHIVYGWRFIQGFLTPRLISKLR